MNWQSLIAELQALGVTQTQMAERCKCTQASISDLATGRTKRPNFEIGTGLIDLHRERSKATAAAKATKAA